MERWHVLFFILSYDEIETKYQDSTSFARKLSILFPSSYLAEFGFCAVNYLLMKKKLNEKMKCFFAVCFVFKFLFPQDWISLKEET